MKNIMQIFAYGLASALILCVAQSAAAQWTGNATIYPTNINASVGIGTNTPLSRLHVKGDAINLRLESTSATNLLGFHSSGSIKGILGTLGNANDLNFGTYTGNTSGKVNLVLGNTPWITLKPTGALGNVGFVGIGIQDPATFLHIKSASNDSMPLRIESGSSTVNRMEYYLNNAQKGYMRVSTDIDFGTSAGGSNKLHLVTGGTRRLTVLPTTGNVGIGTQTPTAQLHVKGGTSTPLKIESATSANTMEYLTAGVKKGYTTVNATDMEFGTSVGNIAKLHLVTGGAKRLTILPTNGNVGIGTNSPSTSAQLTVKGAYSNTLRLESTLTSDYVSFLTTPSGGSLATLKGYVGVCSGNNDLEIRSAISNLSGSINIATANSNTATGNINLVTKGTNRLTVFANGNVGIGTSSNIYALSVNGTIRSREVRVETGWADYVFADGYRLRPLSEVEQFIHINKHLPDVTPAADIQKDGLQVAKQMTEMMQKVEELTLYVIQLDKENKALKAQLARLEADKK